MPIRPELRPLYPLHWRELSSHVRFERASTCQRCEHLAFVLCLPDERWFDLAGPPKTHGPLADLVEDNPCRACGSASRQRLDGQSADEPARALSALAPVTRSVAHLAQHRIAYRRRLAMGIWETHKRRIVAFQ